MTFKCEKCGDISRHGESANRVVVETKPIQYPIRSKANRDGSNDSGGHGFGIKKEIIVCNHCAA